MKELFDNANLMSSEYSFEYLGDFLFKSVETVNLSGVILTKQNESIIPIWDKINEIQLDSVDLSDCSVAGISIGSGILTSLSFENGIDVNTKRFSATIEIHHKGDMSSLSPIYDGLEDANLLKLEFVKSLSEDFSFSKNQDGTYEYTRDLSISLFKGIGIDNVSEFAKSIASLFMSSVFSPFTLASYPDFYKTDGNKFTTESYDDIKGEYSFSESFSFQSEVDYSWVYTTQINVSELDVIVSESGSIKSNTTNTTESLRNGLNNAVSGTYSRCQSAVSGYFGTIPCLLNETESSKNISINFFSGTAEYEISYSTNPSLKGTVFWSKTSSFSLNEDGFFSVSEDGEIFGFGYLNNEPPTPYEKAKDYYNNNVKNTILNRLNLQFGSDISANCSSSLLGEESSKYTESEYEGKVSYSKSYTNNPSIISSGEFSRIETSVEKKYAVPIKTLIQVSYDKEYAVKTFRSNTSEGVLTSTVEVVLRSSSSVFSISRALSVARGKIVYPSQDYYTTDLNYTVDFNASKLTLNCSFNFFEKKSLNSINA